MSISRWQKELEDALNYKNTIILCGNIRDKYLHEEPYTKNECKLLTLKEYLIEFLGRRFNTLRFYDPIKKITHYSQTREKKPSSDLSHTAPQRTSPSESTIDRDLVRISRELTSQTNLCFIIQYTDKTTPEKANSPDEMRLILHLEKIVENIHPTNKQILIYLSPEQIPKEIYQNQPKSKVIVVPSPDRTDLMTLFKYFYKRKDDEVERSVNITDGLKFLEIEQIVDSFKDDFGIKDFENRVRSYKFGELRNYWEEVSLQRLDNAFNYFAQEEGIKGQDKAISKVIRVIIRARADIQRKTGGNPKSPRGVLFFAGPTGVGKTLTAKKLANFLFGSEDTFLRFDMSEYSQDFQVTRLYGAPPGYVGYESGGTLTNAVKTRPFSVILFDEIEKAHPRVFDIFLQTLSDGRLTDSKGDVVFFSESIIIFTSNLGTRTTKTKGEAIKEREALEGLISNNDTERIRQHFLNSVEYFFQYEMSRPELLNRIGRDNIIIFNYIATEDTMKGMLKHHLTQVQKEFNESYSNATPKLNLEMNISEIVEYLYKVYRERIKSFGGREVENIVNERIRDELALQILQAEYQNLSSGTINISVEDDNLRIEL
ncbi:MAG: chaperone ClpB [Candidatus Scalindua rubra]|uniref:Chaperone ClpB n=1 Tax=Candidatus Scalindua rubra TaxID=1872076 RepID=A0A1E3XGF0_9BACT|nr:MAG: chaperone ClpB [Candidatus Scalindua rubra]